MPALAGVEAQTRGFYLSRNTDGHFAGDYLMVKQARPVAEPDWQAIRLVYEYWPDPSLAISERFGVDPMIVADRAKQDGWRRKYRRAKGLQAIIDGMFRIIERRVEDLELRKRSSGEEPDLTTTDREVTLLSNMARTLEKLTELDKNLPARAPRRTTSKAMLELREKLAKRVDRYLAE